METVGAKRKVQIPAGRTQGGRRTTRVVRRLRRAARNQRAPSEAALLAVDTFKELSRFFSSRRELQNALGWSAPTVRQWLSNDRPARPRAQSVRRVMNLLTVCREAGRWVSDPHRVGDWAITPHRELGQVAPAVMVQRLGDEAVAMLVASMERIAPREPVAPAPPDLSVRALRATLHSLGTPSIPPAEPVTDVDLSDFGD
jgi:hypothetical protein